MNESKVTKAQLDAALQAWALARDRAALEGSAWALVVQNQSALIASLRANGHSWAQVEAELRGLNDGHTSAMTAALENLTLRLGEYNRMREAFRRQSGA